MKRGLLILVIVVIVVAFWALSWWLLDYYLDDEMERGAFGDKFGSINSLFSGLAFGSIIISLYFQNQDLALQKKELTDTRKEFINQNFQTTFFNLLKTQRQITDEISCTISYLEQLNSINSKNVQGRIFFRKSREEIRRINDALSSIKFQKYRWWDADEHLCQIRFIKDQQEQDNLEKERKIGYTLDFYNINEHQFNRYKDLSGVESGLFLYKKFHEKHYYVYEHYFEHIYHILSYLEDFKETNINKMDFVNSVKAQLSTPEMFLLYYHCLVDTKLRPLVIKYKLLERLNSQNLIPNHHKIEAILSS